MSKRHIFLAVLVTAIWGFNFPVVKTALSVFSPLSFTTMRFAVSTLALLPFCMLERKHIRGIFKLSLVMGFGHFGLFFYGMSLDIEAATASVLLQIGPPMVVLFGVLLYAEQIFPIQVFGIALSFLGVVILMGMPESAPAFFPAAVIFGAAALWAMGNIMIKQLEAVPVMRMLFWLSLFSTIEIGALWLFVEGPALPEVRWPYFALVAYPALGSTIVGYGIWSMLLRQTPVSQLAPIGLLTPLFAVLSSVLWLGDSFGLWHCVGTACILSGVSCSTFLARRRALLPGRIEAVEERKQRANT